MNGQWDANSANWAVSVTNTATYSDGSAVVFNDKNALTGANVSSTNVTISAPVSPQSITFNNTGAANGGVDYTIGGSAISGAGALIKNGAGTVTLTSANSYTGGTTINAGVLQIWNAGALGSSSPAPLTVSGGTLAVYGFDLSAGSLSGGGVIDNLLNWESSVSAGWGNASSTFSGTIRNTLGGMDLVKAGSGTLTLTGSNAYSGMTVVNGGTLQIGNGGNGASIGSTSGVVMSNDSTLAFNHSDSVVFVPGISGAGDLVKSGSGTLTLAGSIAYTGSTQVSGGTLVLLADNPSSAFTVNNGGTLQFNAATVDLATRYVRAASGGNVQYVNATINGGILRGPGTHATMAGTSNYFSGTSTYGTTNFLQNGSDTFTIFTNGGQVTNNAPLIWDGGVNDGGANLVVNNTVSTDDFTNAGVITINHGGVLNNHLGDMTSYGGGQIYVNSGGTLNADSRSEGVALDLQDSLLVNNGAVAGTTNVNYGATVQGSGTFGPIDVHDGGTLAIAFSASPVIPALTVSSGSIRGAGQTASPAMIADATIDTPSLIDTLTLSGNLSGAGPLTKSGAGLLILSGSNSYGGGTIVAAGTLMLTGNSALPAGTSLTVGAGGTLIFDPSAAGSPVTNSAAAVAVPEPGIPALLIAGAVLLAMHRRRR